MGTMIEFASNGHTARGYLAEPPGSGPGVILIQEYWGLVDQIKGVADRLAAEGFVVLVPDLYHGAASDVPDEALELMMALDMARAAKDLHGAAEHLLGLDRVEGERLGCVGFCMGGGLAVYTAAQEPAIGATVDYYGAIPWEHVELDLSGVSGAVLLHYASEDTWASPEFGRDLEQRLAARGVDATLHVYEGAQHAFLDETRPSYHPEAARLSWERTVAFLRSALA